MFSKQYVTRPYCKLKLSKSPSNPNPLDRTWPGPIGLAKRVEDWHGLGMEVSWKSSLLGQLGFSQLLDHRPKELIVQYCEAHVCTTVPDGCTHAPPIWPSPFGWWAKSLEPSYTDSRLGWGRHSQTGRQHLRPHPHLSHTYPPRESLFLTIKIQVTFKIQGQKDSAGVEKDECYKCIPSLFEAHLPIGHGALPLYTVHTIL